MDLYKFGWDMAKAQSEKSIDGLSGQEEALALATIEQELEDKEEHEHDREAEEESDYQDDEMIYN